MDELEKVEKLRDRANVTYEEARDALKECNGDLLDAMVLLEHQGKTKNPGKKTSYKTITEEQLEAKYTDVTDKVREQVEKVDETFGKKLKKVLSKIGKFLMHNTLVIEHKNKVVTEMPLWLVVLLVAFLWEVVIVAFVISLFCDVKYRMEGEDDLETANTILGQLNKFTDSFSSEDKDEE
ncbi:MAG: hypothetical protein K6C69_06325 [Lachnospiraceae bacterium]|nr:hypothetical protein [Lachnospiraceae bacterium]